MRSIAIFAFLSLVAGTAAAQMSAAQAQQRMEQRQKDRDSARNKTIEITQGQLDDLRAELARLHAEVAKLRSQLSRDTAPPIAAAPPPHDSFSIRAQKRIAEGRFIDGLPPTRRGQREPDSRYSPADARKIRQEAAKVDAAIAADLTAHHVAPDVTEAMWKGHPVVGMSVDELRIIGDLEPIIQGVNGDRYVFHRIGDVDRNTIDGIPVHRIRVWVENGRVVEVD